MSTALPTMDLTGAVWRTSTYSGNGTNSNCVEIAVIAPAVAVRDSKNPAGAILAFPAASWSRFLPTPS